MADFASKPLACQQLLADFASGSCTSVSAL
jgi:hypothetical protein